MNEAKVIQVIETVTSRGHGTSEEDCVRPVRQYWTLDGALLAEVDPVEERRKKLRNKKEKTNATR